MPSFRKATQAALLLVLRHQNNVDREQRRVEQISRIERVWLRWSVWAVKMRES